MDIHTNAPSGAFARVKMWGIIINMSMKKVFYLFVFALVFCSVTPVIADTVWAKPTARPPLGDIGIPITTGATAQSKSGALNVTGNFSVGSGSNTEAAKLKIFGTGWFESGLKTLGDIIIQNNDLVAIKGKITSRGDTLSDHGFCLQSGSGSTEKCIGNWDELSGILGRSGRTTVNSTTINGDTQEISIPVSCPNLGEVLKWKKPTGQTAATWECSTDLTGGGSGGTVGTIKAGNGVVFKSPTGTALTELNPTNPSGTISISFTCPEGKLLQGLSATGQPTCVELGTPGGPPAAGFTGTGQGGYLTKFTGAKALGKSIMFEFDPADGRSPKSLGIGKTVWEFGPALYVEATGGQTYGIRALNRAGANNAALDGLNYGTGVAVHGYSQGGIGGKFESDSGYGLTTRGKVKMWGIGEGGTESKVLSADAQGNARWKTLTEVGVVSPAALWAFVPNTQDIQSTNNGKVGIGNLKPEAKLDIVSTTQNNPGGMALSVVAKQTDGWGVRVTSPGVGVVSYAGGSAIVGNSVGGNGVVGVVDANGVGVNGTVHAGGIGVYGKGGVGGKFEANDGGVALEANAPSGGKAAVFTGSTAIEAKGKVVIGSGSTQSANSSIGKSLLSSISSIFAGSKNSAAVVQPSVIPGETITVYDNAPTPEQIRDKIMSIVTDPNSAWSKRWNGTIYGSSWLLRPAHTSAQLVYWDEVCQGLYSLYYANSNSSFNTEITRAELGFPACPTQTLTSPYPTTQVVAAVLSYVRNNWRELNTSYDDPQIVVERRVVAAGWDGGTKKPIGLGYAFSYVNPNGVNGRALSSVPDSALDLSIQTRAQDADQPAPPPAPTYVELLPTLLEVKGRVKIADNTQGDGKILVSDEVGNATWKTKTEAGIDIDRAPDCSIKGRTIRCGTSEITIPEEKPTPISSFCGWSEVSAYNALETVASSVTVDKSKSAKCGSAYPGPAGRSADGTTLSCPAGYRMLPIASKSYNRRGVCHGSAGKFYGDDCDPQVTDGGFTCLKLAAVTP